MNNYNLLDFNLNKKFDIDFGKNDEKEEDDINQNYLVFDNILESNTFKHYHSSFKYGKISRLVQYSTPKSPKIETLLI